MLKLLYHPTLTCLNDLAPWNIREKRLTFHLRALVYGNYSSVVLLVSVSSVQSLSRVRLFATSWTAALQASLSITNSQGLLKLLSIESVMPSSHPLLSPSPAFNLSQHQGLFKWLGVSQIKNGRMVNTAEGIGFKGPRKEWTQHGRLPMTEV